MTARFCVSTLLAVALAAVPVAACTQTVSGTALRTAPTIDEDSRSPVDVDTVLLDRAELQAITGAGENLTAIPGMQSKTPVDIDLMLDSVPQQCQWVFAETQVFGPDIEEFTKSTYQSPRRGRRWVPRCADRAGRVRRPGRTHPRLLSEPGGPAAGR